MHSWLECNTLFATPTVNCPLTNFIFKTDLFENWMANSPMKNISTAGIAAAIFASFTWSMNFVAPFVIGDYSIFDLAACRFDRLG